MRNADAMVPSGTIERPAASLSELASAVWADAAVVGCAREGDLWAILMPDLSGRFLRDTADDWPSPELRKMLPRFLDGLAGMHAEFWEDPTLDDPRLGLDDPRGLLQLASPTFGRQHLGKWDTWLAEGAVDGWKALQEALDDDAAAQARALIEDPQPLLDALGRHPSTFLHGDVIRTESRPKRQPSHRGRLATGNALGSDDRPCTARPGGV
ncbi:MAG: hypothetical protein ABR500_00040 [Dermatophilaceae bacterium]|nr:hypothetical protein [Intrasporangiaceae bacterium]